MPTTASKMEKKNFSAPAEVRPFEKGKVEVLQIGDHTVARATFEPGWKWSTCIGPIAKTRSCEAAHLGYQLSGKMQLRMDDGSEVTVREQCASHRWESISSYHRNGGGRTLCKFRVT